MNKVIEMKRAPNLKEQPRDKMTEVIIFAGSDAFAHAKQWHEYDGRLAGDNVPPVWLGDKQLKELADLEIIDKGRYCVRLFKAGHIESLNINAIAQKLAAAGVKDANYYPEGMHNKDRQNWRDYLERLRENQPDKSNKETQSAVRLSKLADSERAQLLAEHLKNVCINEESETVFVWRGDMWSAVSRLELEREMVGIYTAQKEAFSRRVITSAVEAMKVIVQKMLEPCSNLLPFSNGVLDLLSGEFFPHSPDHWNASHNGIEYTPPLAGENEQENAPNFWKWLNNAASGDAGKMQRIRAALYMILTNRYDWQLFIEVTGEGGSGKSTFTHIARLLAGEKNSASVDMVSLDDAGGRAQVADSRLIVLADQPKYTGEGAGIKKITGGDPVEINPKYENRFTTVIRAVVLATNNEPMIFTERAGGVSRRRVIFQFNNIINETEKDKDLPQKIAAEIPVVIRCLLDDFANPENARALLIEQRDSAEALEIKQQTDPVVDLCDFLTFLDVCNGLMMGGGSGASTVNNSLYRVYLAYMDYMGRGKPLSVTEFGKAMKISARIVGFEYKTRKYKGRTQTNVITKEDVCKDFLNGAYRMGQ